MDHELAYSLWGENCWKYAHARAEAILNSCIELASDDKVRRELQKELENLLDARRRMPNEVVDIVQEHNILWVVSVCIPGIWGCQCLVLGKNLAPPSIRLLGCELVAIGSSLIVLQFIGARAPVFSYNLTWLRTTYHWPLHLLAFCGYCIGWNLCFCGLEFMARAECQRLSTTNPERKHREIFHQDDTLSVSRSIIYSFGCIIVILVMTFEQKIGYSYGIRMLRLLTCGGLIWILAFFLNSKAGRTGEDELHEGFWVGAE